MPELLQRNAALVRRRGIDRGEFVAPVPRPAGVDDGAAIRVIAHRLAFRLDARIQWRRPGIADDVDRGCRIGPRDQCPDHLLEIRDVDIVVDHDRVAAAIGSDVAHRGDMAGLPGVAGIALLDGNHEQEPRAANLMRPSGRDAGHTGLLDVFPQQCRTNDGAITADFVRRTLGRAPEQNRIVAVIDRLDVQYRLGPQVAGVIAGPLAERSFDAHVVGLDETLDHDFGVGRDGQPGDRPFDHLDWSTADAADDVELADAVRQLAATHQETHGVAAADDGDRHALAARLIFIAHLAAMLAGGNVETDRFLVVDHHPVGAAIDPAVVRIARDVVASGADIASAVGFMPLRHREFRNV